MTLKTQELEKNVIRITLEGESAKEIVLVGTAHVSKSSAELAERIIKELSPNAVAVELCASRYESIKDPDRWKRNDILTILREKKTFVVLVQLVLAAFQKRMGDKLHIKPGAEMLSSIKAAEELAIPIVLADREIRTTLRRAWSSVRFWTLVKIFFSSLTSSFRDPEITEREIELLKEGDALNALLAEFSEELPDIKVPLIEERDRYLASKLRDAPYERIVAVVGAGHVPGILDAIDKPINRDELEVIPPPKRITQILGLLIPTIILVAVVIGFFFSGADTSAEMVLYWTISTGIAAAIGALICLAHPFTIVSSALAAPITTLHPLLAAGWIAGFVEAWIRKPQVEDLNTILDDIGSLRGIWSNRLARVFLVVIIVNLTTSLGMIYGTSLVTSLLIK